MGMMRLKLAGLAATLLVTLTQAGNGGDSGWGSSSCATVYSTAPTTIVDVTTETDIESTTIVSPTTIVETTTVIRPTTIVVPTTLVSLSTAVSIESSTITDTVPTTIISVSATTDTISTYPGLVTCTSRIINPTYTPKSPLPTNYLWGCAPGTICTPPQIGCNWEQNPPADTYVCAPEECKPVPELFLPANLSSLWPNRIDTTCAWDEPAEGYFHLNPQHFNLTFAIFDVLGQPLCPAPTTTTTWADWTSSPPKPTSTWAPKMPRRGLMANPLAEIVSRQTLLNPPAQCYRIFDAANTIGQNVGLNYPELCPSTTQFQQAIGQCQTCSRENAGGATGAQTFPELQMYFTWCNTHTS
ncbi:uncharacterized protein Z520_09032 [Fonsecaea multimorphosa CBS 102226]|uniref:Ig-like domain-containing protein n=1 Tax=Fonsecaea multimorphosa CBS 102226 TaxID=1442371 RepID=A0A0D2IDA1_9EURO|nr:uncharacterized protein Z520_09032 [Fonsecaea multimorphosa CBS 102226]KIX95116.1 hypothetical protein Z520_09032 [Fonsecaea multimorphosa CBS 102226]